MNTKHTRIAIKRRGFASMSVEQRKMIAGRGGKKAHALGKAHRWTPEEAGKAGPIGGRVSKKHKLPRT